MADKTEEIKARKKIITRVQDLEVYQLAFKTAMLIFDITQSFPKEEKYSLVDQIRRSSRAVCSCLGEAWRKRRYRAYFINKLSDASAEAGETQIWLEFAKACQYIDDHAFNELYQAYESIFAMLYTMEKKVEKFLL